MWKIMPGLVGLLAVSLSSSAQTAAPAAQRLPRGTALAIKSSEFQAAAEKTDRGIVQVMRLAHIDDGQTKYNIVVALLHRTPKGDTIEEHSDITEVYQILSGHGTLETGGTIEGIRSDPPNPRIGPGFGGTAIRNGVSREVGPGDVIIIPPNTPHLFTSVKSDKIVYISIRIDPHLLLGIPPADVSDAAAAEAADAASAKPTP